MSDKESIGRAVDATVEHLNSSVTVSADESFDLAVPPPPVKPEDVPVELVDECFHQETVGDGRILGYLFKNRYLRDNNACSDDEKNKYKYVYKFVGSHWERCTGQSWHNVFCLALAGVWNLRAQEFYDELLANFDEGTKLAEVRALLKFRVKEADPAQVALLKRADEHVARAKKCLDTPRMLKAANSAFSDRGLLGFWGEWNTFDKLLPFINCTVDLTTGQAMAPRPEHYFNLCIEYEYKGLNHDCPHFMDMIFKVFCRNEDLIDYFHHFIGVAITGIQTKDFFVFIGPEADNGKSVLFSYIAKLLKAFTVIVDVDIFLRQTSRNAGGAHPEELRLQHKRLALTQEADAGDVFGIDRIKMFTSGGDEMEKRTILSADYVRFSQKQTVGIHTNSTPRMSGGDNGMANRMRIILFGAKFFDASEGPERPSEHRYHKRERSELYAEFDAEMAGIFAWFVRGSIKFAQNNFLMPPPPPVVARESEEYLLENDIVKQFINTATIKSEGGEIGAAVLYREFKKWCEQAMEMSGKEIMSQQRFGREMKRLCKSKRQGGTGNKMYLGIALDPFADYGAPKDNLF